MTDDRPDADRDVSTPTVSERWRELLVEAYGIDPEQARAIRATAFSDPALTLDTPDGGQIRASVRSALADYNFAAVLDEPDAADTLEAQLLTALEEGLNGRRPGPAIAPGHIREQSTTVAMPESQREHLLTAVEQVLNETDWGEYGLDDPGSAFVDETVNRLDERIVSDTESDSRPSGTASPEATESAPGLGPGIDAAAQRGYNFEQPGSETESTDAYDLPEITSASTVRDLIDDADLSTAQVAALVEYLQEEYLTEDDGE